MYFLLQSVLHHNHNKNKHFLKKDLVIIHTSKLDLPHGNTTKKTNTDTLETVQNTYLAYYSPGSQLSVYEAMVP